MYLFLLFPVFFLMRRLLKIVRCVFWFLLEPISLFVFLLLFQTCIIFFFFTVVFSFSSVRVAFEYRQNKQTKLSLSEVRVEFVPVLRSSCLFFFNLELS